MGNSAGFLGIMSAMAMRMTATPSSAVRPMVTRSLRSCDANVGEKTPEEGSMWIDLKKVNRNREISGMKRETLAKKIFSNR